MTDLADVPILSALEESRARLSGRATTAEQKRLVGPAVAEIDRAIASLDPATGTSFELTPMVASVPPRMEEIEALRREVERLSALAQHDRGLLDAILHNSPHGIIVSDTHGKLVLVNRASERIWAGSATAEDVEGWGQYRAFHADGRPYAPSDWAMARCLSNGETITAEEVHFQRFDGTHGMLLGSCAPIRSSDGEITGALGVFADITEFKQLETKLRRNEAWLATTLRSIGDAVIAADKTGRIDFMNPMSEQLTGWTMQDAKGQLLSDVYRIIDVRTHEHLVSPATKVLRSGKTVGVVEGAVLVRKDGTELSIDDSGAPIMNEDGDLSGVVLVFRDVTARRRAEQRRHLISEASRKLAYTGLDYDATLENVAGLAVPHVADIAIVDILESDGAVARLAAVHAVPDAMEVAAALRERYPMEPDLPSAVHSVLQRGESVLWPELTDAWPYASVLRELGIRAVMIVPLRARGRTCGAISLLLRAPRRRYDLDDLTLAEELSSFAALALDNAQVYREAQQVNRAKDVFLATLSHELRTPLTAILGWTRMLRQGALRPETQVRALEAIERNAALQTQLVGDLLDASRIITGKLRLDVTPIDLPPVVNAAIDAVRHGADAKGIELQVQFDSAVGPIIGDPTRLQQVVWNLLSNAIKFTPKGGHVSVSLLRADGAVRIEVRDDGRGISAEFLPHVFDRFRQEDGTSTRSAPGLGLGLAIARHLVELHGGSVRAESEGEGKGACFTVDLPISMEAGALGKAGHGDGLLESEPTLQGLTILVVDDEEDARELIRAVLERKGAKVTTVATAEETFEAIHREKPDVLLSDLGMPGEDGYSLIKRLRAQRPEDGGRIPAAALTAYASAQDRARALLAGFQSHVPKPIEAAELAAVIVNLVGRV